LCPAARIRAKKNFSPKGKAHPRKKGNNNATPKIAAFDFFSLRATAFPSILVSPFLSVLSDILT
jgi:sarcosine oxidase delta subunit